MPKTRAELDWEALQIVLKRAEKINPRYPDAIRAVAIPHWFDAEILTALLGEDVDAPALVTWLAERPFVERYGERAYTLHERTRDSLRAHLWADDAARYREWSARAAEFYQKRLGKKAMLAQLMGPRAAELTREEGKLYNDIIYHQLAVDDAAAFTQFEQAFQEAESAWQLATCQSLVVAVREQVATLTGDRPLWLCYYEGRLLGASQRWSEEVAVQREVLAQNPEGRLRAWILQELGNSLHSLGDWKEAIECYKQDLEISRELGHRAAEAGTLNNIGIVYLSQGRWWDALAQYEASLVIARELGDRAGEARTLNNIGTVYRSQGRWGEALTQYEASLKSMCELGDRAGEAATLNSLAIAWRKQGQWDRAIGFYQQSLAIDRELGAVDGESAALNNLGVVLAKKGAWSEAIANYEASLAIERRLSSHINEARILGNLADLFKETGEWEKAHEYYQQAIQTLHDTEDREQLAEWLEELAELYRDQHKWDDALKCEEEALAIWREMAKRDSINGEETDKRTSGAGHPFRR